MSNDGITIRKPDDFHVHLREGEPLAGYSRTLARTFARALVMPNTKPPITRARDLIEYTRRINEAAPSLTPLGTFKLVPTLTPPNIDDLARAGAIAGKYYPAGVTTNAEDGLQSPDQAKQLFARMEELGIVLCIHAEAPGEPVLDRERAFLPVVERLARDYPDIRIVVEHVSTKEAVALVKRHSPQIAATVTVHHLLNTIEDLLGDGLQPHLYCKPVLKSAEDRAAIQRAVLGGHPAFFFGSDSAPHDRDKKEGSNGAAGVYSAPAALALLLEFFERNDALDLIEPFTSELGAHFYRLPLNESKLRCVRKAQNVPDEVDGCVPLGAGRVLDWSIEE